MKLILISAALVSCVTAAKLDHLEYLPPHSRPTSANGNQDAGLAAPEVSANLKLSPAGSSFGQNGPNNGFGQQSHTGSQPTHQQPSSGQFGGVQTQQPQQPSAFPSASQKYTQPQPTTSFNQKASFEVKSNDDTVEIDAPVVGDGQNSFGLPNPSRQYLSPFGNQPKNTGFSKFNGPAKLQSIFGNQNSAQPQQQPKPSSFGNFNFPSSPTQQYQPNKFQAPSPQPSHSTPHQNAPSQATNGFAPSHTAPQQSGSTFTSPSQSNNGFTSPHSGSQPSGPSFGVSQRNYQAFGPQNQLSSAAPKSFQRQQLNQHTQNSAPYQYNKPTTSFGNLKSQQGSGLPQNGFNAQSGEHQSHNGPSSQGFAPQNTFAVPNAQGGHPGPSFGVLKPQQGSSLPQSGFHAPSSGQKPQNGPSTEGFVSQNTFAAPHAHGGQQIPQGFLSGSQPHGGAQNQPQSFNPQQTAPQKSSQHPVQAQDENGGYLY